MCAASNCSAALLSLDCVKSCVDVLSVFQENLLKKKKKGGGISLKQQALLALRCVVPHLSRAVKSLGANVLMKQHDWLIILQVRHCVSPMCPECP